MPALAMRVPFCGLPCPEVVVDTDVAGKPCITGGCPVCRDAAATPRGSTDDPPRIDGHPAAFGEAIDAAASLLARARSPLVYGLSRSPVGAARAAARVARALRGAIDIEGSAALAPDLETLSTFGLAAATFGEIRARADVVLLWRCDPRGDHPHLLPAGASIVLVPPASAGGGGAGGGQLLPIAPGGDLEALLILRALVNGATPRVTAAGRVAAGELAAAAAALRKARYAVIVWDSAATTGPAGLAVVSALTLLARDLNDGGRAAARPLGPGGNIAGATSALLSVTGLPRAAGFYAGGPDRLADPLDGATMIACGAADAVLLVGARRLPMESAGGVADDAASPAARRPALVVVGSTLPEGCPEPEVFLPAAAPGFDGAGLFQRADGVPVPVRATTATGRPQEAAILEALLARLPSGKASS